MRTKSGATLHHLGRGLIEFYTDGQPAARPVEVALWIAFEDGDPLLFALPDETSARHREDVLLPITRSGAGEWRLTISGDVIQRKSVGYVRAGGEFAWQWSHALDEMA